MSQELERVYTIPLGKVKISQSQHRAVRAINMIREFARHHMKVETIKIDEELARDMWARGVRNPPRKVRVRMSKTDEGYILVTKYTEDEEAKVTPEKETKKVVYHNVEIYTADKDLDGTPISLPDFKDDAIEDMNGYFGEDMDERSDYKVKMKTTKHVSHIGIVVKDWLSGGWNYLLTLKLEKYNVL